MKIKLGSVKPIPPCWQRGQTNRNLNQSKCDRVISSDSNTKPSWRHHPRKKNGGKKSTPEMFQRTIDDRSKYRGPQIKMATQKKKQTNHSKRRRSIHLTRANRRQPEATRMRLAETDPGLIFFGFFFPSHFLWFFWFFFPFLLERPTFWSIESRPTIAAARNNKKPLDAQGHDPEIGPKKKTNNNL